jgi:hypothetical protein
MNFQEKLFKTTADFRARAAALANEAVTTARTRASATARRAESLKGSLGVIAVAARALNKVARRHAVRFVKENASIAAEARKDVAMLARTTYATLARRGAVQPKRRKIPTARKRASAKAA